VAIRATVPAATIVLPGIVWDSSLAGLGSVSTFTDIMLSEMVSFLQENPGSGPLETFFNAFSFRLRGDVHEQERGMISIQDCIKHILEAHDVAIPAWITGFDLLSGDSSEGEKRQADCIARLQIIAIVRGFEVVLYGVDRDGFPPCFDQVTIEGNASTRGIKDADGTLKISFSTIEAIKHLVSGGVYIQDLLEYEGYVDAKFRAFSMIDATGRVIVCYWNDQIGMVKQFRLSIASAGEIDSWEKIWLNGTACILPSTRWDEHVDQVATDMMQIVRISNTTMVELVRIQNVFPEAAWIVLQPIIIVTLLGVVAGMQQQAAKHRRSPS
jgi:hypothetical protein